MTQIDLATFPKFGTMTGSAGLAGIFDTVGASTCGHAEATTGTAGVDFRGTPQSVDKVVLWSAGNGWDASGSDGGQVRFKLFGKQGAAPASQTDGVLLGSAGPIRDVNAVRAHAIYSSDWLTKWDWIWVQVTSPTWVILSGFELYAPYVPQIGTDRRVLRRRSDSSQPISKNISDIHGLRFLFELTQPSAITPFIKIEIEHMAWATGVSHLLSCGALLKHRCAETLGELAMQEYSTIDDAGRNLSTSTHYERQSLCDSVHLGVGFHEIIPALNSNTYQSASDWYTTVLVEGKGGLNKGVILIDPGAEVINL
jgi:hypothetical protein